MLGPAPDGEEERKGKWDYWFLMLEYFLLVGLFAIAAMMITSLSQDDVRLCPDRPLATDGKSYVLCYPTD